MGGLQSSMAIKEFGSSRLGLVDRLHDAAALLAWFLSLPAVLNLVLSLCPSLRPRILMLTSMTPHLVCAITVLIVFTV